MTPESGVLKAVCDLLAAERIPFWRMNTGAIKTEKRFFRFGQKGMADILAAPQRGFYRWEIDLDDACTPRAVEHPLPSFLWIECKSETGRQSAEQRDFECYVIDKGMHYLLARSSDDVLAWLKDNGVKR